MARLFMSIMSLVVTSFAALSMTFREEGNGGNCNGCDWIVAEGEITPDTPGQFAKFMSDKNYRVTIYLNSPGGDLTAGLRLGELIRAKGLETAVGTSEPDAYHFRQLLPGKCASACAYAFLGGVSREAKSGELGVHQFYSEASISNPSERLFNSLDLSVNQLISAVVIDYVFRMGADPRVVSIASATPPGSMYFFSEEDLASLKVTWQAKAFTPWAIEPAGTGVIAYSKTQDKTETATFYCGRDKTFRLLISAPVFDSAPQLQEAINQLDDGIEALGLKLPKEAATVRTIKGTPALEIHLNGLDLRKIQPNARLAVNGPVPRVNAAYFFHPLSSEHALQSFRIAARNCLQ